MANKKGFLQIHDELGQELQVMIDELVLEKEKNSGL